MSGKRRLVILISIMTTLGLAVGGITLYALYQAAVDQQQKRLLEIVNSRARFLEAVAEHEKRFHYGTESSGDHGDPFSSALNQIRASHEAFTGFGETGEFTLARRDGEQIVFLLRHRHHDLDHPRPVPLSSHLAVPMRMALQGKSGTVVGLDYRGERVLAAFEPVSILDLGIVAKIDLAEIRAPFIRAGRLAAGYGLVLIFLGALLFLKITNPMITDLEKQAQDLKKEVEERTRTLRALRRSEKRLAKAQRISQIGDWELELKTGRVIGSEELYRILGLEPGPDPLTNERLRECFHPGDRDKYDRVAERLQQEANVEFEHRILGPGGETRWVWGQSEVVNDDSGAPVRMFGVLQDITERKGAEQKLRESEERLRALFDGTSSCILFIEDHVIKYVNRATARTFGYAREEMFGRNTSLIHVSQESFEEAESIIYPALEKEGSWNGEWPFRKKYGEIAWMENNITRVSGGGIVAVLHDITARKRAQEALRESEERFRILYEKAPIPYQSLNEDGYIIQANQAWFDTLGYRPGEVIGHSFSDFLPPDQRDLFQERFPRFKTLGSILGTEFVMICKDGSEKVVSFNGTIGRDTAGEFMMTHCVFTDITARKQAEERLQELVSLIEKSNEFIGLTTLDGKMEFVNEAGLELLGIEDLDEALGLHISQVIPDYTRAIMEQEILPALLETGFIKREALLLNRKNGRQIQVEIGGSLFRSDVSGTPRGIITIIRDITERKEAEKEKSRLEWQLIQSQKIEATGTLAGGIAHDFNNILGAILGYAELAQMKLPESSEAVHDLKQIFKAGYRAKDLVQQILTFSRQMEQERKPVPVRLVLEEALKLLRASVPTTIEFRTDFRSHALTLGDASQIHQVVMNLCTNAAHAMGERGGTLEVSLEDVELDAPFHTDGTSLNPGPFLKVTVSDTGHGMSPEIQGKIFDPFFTTKERGQGTGMGLAVAHGIVKSHGGTIHVYSEPGQGTSFKVFLPAIEQELGPEETVDKPLPGGTERILLIDDEKTLVDMGKQMLQALGYEVTARTDSREALELFRQDPSAFQLVVTDMTMPGLPGDELACQMLAVRPDLPVILCTGFSTRISEETALGMGIRAFLMKPLVLRDLAETVRRLLDRSPEAP